LTQEAAAQALRVPVATWRGWEQGDKVPRPDGPLRLLLETLDHVTPISRTADEG
jgi:DNA-binding transcriptional regulator YiaG